MLTEIDSKMTEERSSTDERASSAYQALLKRAPAKTKIADLVTVTKNDGAFAIELAEPGKELHSTYESAFRLAEESGVMNRDVLDRMAELKAAWPSHPGVLENEVNDAIEEHEPARGVEAARVAVDEWMSVLKKAGVKAANQIDASTEGAHLFVQLLANYEFALERNEELDEALGIALLVKEIDPSDPENILSSVVGLYIRTGQPMRALRTLEPLQESLAPYVVYGRALAYYALEQRENASVAIQTALRAWPDVARAITREWKGGTPMPNPGVAVSELQVLYGYYEVFGATWKSVPGAINWLREEAAQAERAGAKQQRYIGLTRSGLRTDAQGNAIVAEGAQSEEAKAAEQAALLRASQLIGEDAFVRFLEVRPNEFVYDLTERGKELEEAHSELYRRDMKLQERIEAIQEMLKEWPGHANAAIALARYYGQRDHFDQAIELIEKTIFDLQKFWPEDMEDVRITSEWPGNKPMLTAYAYMVLDCAEAGDHASAKAFADDYLKMNPIDNLGVRQKAIEVMIQDGEYAEALRLINEAADPISAHNVFGRALLGYVLGANDAELALKSAVESRPLVWREMVADKHRMPHNYNPSFVHYFSPEEAYNYQQLWAPVWLKKHGALAWLKKEGRKYVK
jgi:tetratricopeptide (TPR) repeat protein